MKTDRHLLKAVMSVTVLGGGLPEAFGTQLFPTLINAEEDYTARCCRALDRLLDYTPVEVIICQVRDYLAPN